MAGPVTGRPSLHHQCGRPFRHDGSRRAVGGREPELAPLLVHQHHGDHRHEEVHGHEQDVSQMGMVITEAGLDEDRRVVPDDRVDARGLVAAEDDAGQHEGQHVAPLVPG